MQRKTIKKANKTSKPTKPVTLLYEKLRNFRQDWEAKGGTRRTLRYQRKVQGHTLFPNFVDAAKA